MINLISNTNNSYTIDKNTISILSHLIGNMLEDDDKNNESNINIPLPFGDNVIKKIVDYCNYFHSVPNIYEDDLKDIKTISKWYSTFIDVDDEMVFKLLRISDLLYIESLLELCLVKICAIIKGKTLNELDERFNTDSHFTGEELEEFKSSHNWKFKV